MKKISLLILALTMTAGIGSNSFGSEASVSFELTRKVMPSLTEIMTLIWGSEAQSMDIIGRTETGIFSVKHGGQVFEIDSTIYHVSPFLFKKMVELMGQDSLKVSYIRHQDGIIEFFDKNSLVISSAYLPSLSEKEEAT